MPSVAITAALYRKWASPDTAARITKFFTQFWNASKTSTFKPARVMPPSCFTSVKFGSLCLALAIVVSVASRSTDLFSGLDMWRSRVSAASDARLALPGEATRLAVVAVRARVVADGRFLAGAGVSWTPALLAIWAAWKGCKRWGCAAASGLQLTVGACDAKLNRGAATVRLQGLRKMPKIFLCHHKAAAALVVRTGATEGVWQASRGVCDDAWR